MSMMVDDEPIDLAEALEQLDQNLLAARLEVARIRKFDRRPPAMDALKQLLEETGKAGIAARSYHSHESGERRPRMSRLKIYARLFDIPLSYLVMGTDAHKYEAEARRLAARTKTKLKIEDFGDPSSPGRGPVLVFDAESKVNEAPVNQTPEDLDSNTIHNPGVRLIVVLKANEVRKLKHGRGVPANMSGQRIPVPDFLNASPGTFGYQIPDDDVSMLAPEGLSFNGGGHCVVDPAAKILPGKYVLAVLKDEPEPVIRQYVASGPYASGRPFELKALNPAYRAIEVTDKGACTFIARIVFFGNLL
jgi:Peptidase S24-like